MSVLILKNASKEGPGTIEDYLGLNRIPYSIIDLAKGEDVPDSGDYDTLVILGGPMSVNDDLLYIRKEEELIRAFISEGKKVLGICLGAQIMAKAFGEKVYKGPAKEIGWLDIELGGEGLRDPAMQALYGARSNGEANRAIKVFQWHSETFNIPQGAVKLATSSLYPNQAFRIGDSYAFQFHIEVNRGIIDDWMASETIDHERLSLDTASFYDKFAEGANAFYMLFFNKNQI
jgi:GMP synthase-like glutamine amidotransferase